MLGRLLVGTALGPPARPRVQRVPPGPPPARGIVDELMHFRDLRADVLGTLGQRFATYGDFYYASVVGFDVYSTCDPDITHDVLVTHAARFRKRSIDLEVLGNGLLLSEGEHWRRQRRRIQPGFRHESIQRYAALIAEEVERLLARLGHGSVIDVRAEMLELTLRVVCRALFGQSFGGDARRLARAMHVLQEAVVTPKLAPPWLPTPRRLRHERMRAIIDQEVYAILDRAEAAPGSLLHELRAAVDDQGGMTRQELRDEVVTLFLAGHETTALALTWAFYLVALHPHIDRALADELRRGGGAPPSARELESLDLAPRVLKESMRLYPPVYVIPRIVERAVKLGGYWLAPGATIWLWTYFMQRDPRWFHLPDRFDPDRFLPNGEASRQPRAYIPFGAGTRSCIGKHFANLEALMVLSAIVARYRLELVDTRPLPLRPRVTLSPARPLRVRLVSR
jgi:cytochrome P450